MLRLLVAVTAVAVASGCQCGQRVVPLDPAQLVVAPSPLVLPDAWVGFPVSATVQVTNQGGVTAELAVSIDAPFTVSPAALTLTRGDSQTLTVSLTPTAPGAMSGTLHVGPIDVPVTATARAVPPCPATACHETHFDPATGQCVSAAQPDGSACTSACVTQGQCSAGVCQGSAVSCDDGDPCTDDACSPEVGCLHPPHVCPSNVTTCQAATCDPTAGCATETALDGTLCGPDNCALPTVQVCIVGQCVMRPRPGPGQCVNTWVPLELPPRAQFALAYDSVRQRTVLFGGLQGDAVLGDTWEWDGATWTFHTPATSPPPRFAHAMAWDPARQRVILFGGSTARYGAAERSDLWEWDGTTWVERQVSAAPPPRAWHAMTFDTRRRTLVVYGGAANLTSLHDLWEWDGASWAQRTAAGPSAVASANGSMAYDDARGKTVLVLSDFGQVWEWDGTSWTHPATPVTPSPRSWGGLTWDGARRRVVLYGGLGNGHGLHDTWEWDGTAWAQRTLTAQPPVRDFATIAWDGARQRLVMLSGDDPQQLETWELAGQTWSRAAAASPASRFDPAVTWDRTRHRLVLFGGYTPALSWQQDTWEWDQTAWQLRTLDGSGPSARSAASLTYDPVKNQGVLFGGQNGLATLGDTWTWDGASWKQLTPLRAPSARTTQLAWDGARQQVVFFGGDPGGRNVLADTWLFDGTQWSSPATSLAPTPRLGALAFDATRQQVVLFGGETGLGSVTDETWLWNGVSWAQPMLTRAPPARRYSAMAYDVDRQVTLLFGGDDPALADTWEWDGSAWAQRQPSVSPPATSQHVLVWVDDLHRVVLVGPSGLWAFVP